VEGTQELLLIFGTNVRQHRRAKGWSQDRLAERAGLSSQTISTIERGMAASSFETAARIAQALAVPPPALFAVGTPTLSNGDRGKLLLAINATLSRLNEAQLARAAKMLEAFAGS
jgi:transcriptional regulator with XRE-family HTH domain